LTLYNGCASHQEDRAVSIAQHDGTWRWTAGNVVRAARSYGTDDGDLLRYLAYCNAFLGRPYQTYYVRPRSAWMQSFAETDKDAANSAQPSVDQTQHPDDFGVTAPTGPLMPYRDFLVEYPPGFFLVVLPPAWLATWISNSSLYPLLFSSLMALCLLGALWSCQRMLEYLPWPRTWGAELAKLATWSALAAGVICTRRYDAAVSLLLCLTSWAFLADKIALCGVLLGLAIAVKGMPILVLPILALVLLHRRRWRDLTVLLVTSTAVVALVFAPAVHVGGARVLDSIVYHFQRPLEVESTPGAILGIVQPFLSDAQESIRTFGSINLESRYTRVFATASISSTLLGVLVVYLAFWRRLRLVTEESEQNLELLRATAAVLVLFMVCGKVFSPQYLIWLLPLGLLLSLGGPRSRWLLPATMLLGQLIYPICYGSLAERKPWAFALVLLRSGLVVSWLVALYRNPDPVPGRLSEAQSTRL
jgi:hypothetical protein